MMASKSQKRTESKKKKAAAFLQLVKAEQMCSSGGAMASSADPCNEPDSKKAKLDGPNAADTKKKLPDTVLTEYTQELRRRQKAAMQKPKIFLTLDELTLTHPMNEERGAVKQLPPLFVTDVQHLLLHALLGRESSYKSRWCRLLRAGKVDKVVVVVADAVSAEDFHWHSESLPTLKHSPDVSVEMVSPAQYGSTVREDLLNVPLSMMQMKKLNVHGRLSKTVSLGRAMAPVSGEKISRPVTTSDQDKFDRTCLLLNTAQMMYEGFPMPVRSNSRIYHKFVHTKDCYADVTSDSPMYAVDCEMVQTEQRINELARISVVNENRECVYDSFVKPHNKITDYVTRFSGITKAILDPVTTRLEDVQQYLRDSLPTDAILLGQSLNGDLSSMKMFHPYVIDTSVVYNLTGQRWKKTGLRKLTDFFLGRSIQDSEDGHCSREDATATMDLVLLKLRNGIAFGDVMSMSTPDNMRPGSTETSGEKRAGCDKCGSTVDDAGTSTPVTCTCDTRTSGSTTCDSQTSDSSTPASDTHTSATTTCDSQTSDSKPPASDTRTSVVVSSDSEDNTAGSLSQTTLGDPPSRSSGTTSGHPPVQASQTTGEDNTGHQSGSTACDGPISQLAANQLELANRRMYFQRKGNKYIQSFFDVLNQHRKSGRQPSGKVIDEKASVDLYPKSRQTGLVESGLVEESSEDKESERLTLAALADHDFTLTYLYGYRDHLQQRGGVEDRTGADVEQTKKCLWKLDRRVWKIQKEVPPNSVFVVILPGRLDDHVHAAMTFAKVT